MLSYIYEHSILLIEQSLFIQQRHKSINAIYVPTHLQYLSRNSLLQQFLIGT